MIVLNLKWRRTNKHNSTSVNTKIPLDIVSVGNKSYGELNVFSYGHNNEKLIIGNYVSIAKGVKFILGGNHQINTYTCFPLYSHLYQNNPEMDAISKGPIIIGDEVWLGFDSLILSGVTIGRGAIVAAGSVVTKDVSDYSIVGGNPAKLIRNRFDDTILQKLKNINLLLLSEDEIIQNMDLFYKDLSISISDINDLASK